MKINLFARGQRARLQRAYSLSSPSWQFYYRVLERLLSLSDAAPLGRGHAEPSVLAAVARCLDS